MMVFACDRCGAQIFFDNFRCVRCGLALAFVPELATMSALEMSALEELPSADETAPAPTKQDAKPAMAARPAATTAKAAAAEAKRAAPSPTGSAAPAQKPVANAEDAPAPSAAEPAPEPQASAAEEPAAQEKPQPKRYTALADGRCVRMCQNHVDFAACNWAVPDTDPEPLCLACRLNDVIPDLSKPELREAWLQLEAAKRRLLYTLYQLKLPVEGRDEDEQSGLRFAFMAGAKEQPVFTGHSDGLITINVAEADDPFREKMRAQLGEAYRTVLGHFRHEVGHYYWDRLIKDSDWLEKFRALFGDERADYAEALKRHYEDGAPADWAERYVSQYASMHPWEDWAETWAHYLHMFDTLGTAKAYGLRVKVATAAGEHPTVVNTEKVSAYDFEQMVEDWIPLTLALNSLNRSMGLRDVYPFVLTKQALHKLRFVHQVIHAPTPPRAAHKPKPANAKVQPEQPARQLAHAADLAAELTRADQAPQPA